MGTILSMKVEAAKTEVDRLLERVGAVINNIFTIDDQCVPSLREGVTLDKARAELCHARAIMRGWAYAHLLEAELAPHLKWVEDVISEVCAEMRKAS